MKSLSDQKKGSLLAFIAVMFITPDSLFIRLSIDNLINKLSGVMNITAIKANKDPFF